ncbi:hypothetical protein FO519_010893, partial [Halicephalobus sp. NKZ332]
MDPGQNDDPPEQGTVAKSPPSFLMETDENNASRARELLKQLPSNTEEDFRKRFVKEVKERKSVFPDTVMLRQFAEAGV